MKTINYKLLMPFLLALISSTLGAQVWNSVGNGIPQMQNYSRLSSTTHNGDLYVSYSRYSANHTLYLSKWNGLSWVTSSVVVPVYVSERDVEVYNGEAYITAKDRIYKFDGTNWTSYIPTGMTGNIRDMTVHNGLLYIVGDFTANGGIDDIMTFNGTSFSPFTPTGLGYTDKIENVNGTLYITSSASSNTYQNFLMYNGTSWVQVAHYNDANANLDFIYQIIEFNNEIYVQATHGSWPNYFQELAKVENDTLKLKGNVGFSISDYTSYNGDLFLVGNDSSVTVNPYLVKYDGNTLGAVPGTPSTLYTVDSVYGDLVVGSLKDSLYNGIVYNHMFRTNMAFNGKLSGTAYDDINTDCFINNGEQKMSNAMVGLSGNNVVTTDLNGDYNIFLVPGTYTFSASYIPKPTHKNYQIGCPLPNQITIAANQNVTQNIGLSNPVSNDLIINISGFTGSRARHGFTEKYKVTVSNAGNSTVANCNFEIELPSTVQFVSSMPSAGSQTGNTLNYSIINLQPYQESSFMIEALIDTAQNTVLDSIVFLASITGFSNDADLSDNTDTLKQQVRAALDPNDKQASEDEIAPNTNQIDYHIRFQNTGTDTAYKVTIVDTLALNLPITSIMVNSASHPYSLSVVNNVLIWEFDNILLPDSSVDYQASQGFVNFTTNISPGLAIGDTIKNKAEIYFDFQKPVITNHAKTVVVQPITVEEYAKVKSFKVYPNPAHDKIFVESLGNKAINFEILNMQGALISSHKVRPFSIQTIDISNLDSGVYLIRSNETTYKLIITQ